MVVVPGDIPVTTPEKAPTVATDGALLVQVPPAVASKSKVSEPTQSELEPLIDVGSALTVMFLVA